jgi:RNA polymerase sigma-70 factor, ECF subfamily
LRGGNSRRKLAAIAVSYRIRRITDQPPDITGVLPAWRDGDDNALNRLPPVVHEELHRIAVRCMGGERAGHSLQATALVNEAYLRLMRRVLVDHARARQYEKRGGGAQRVTLIDGIGGSDERSHDLLAWLLRELKGDDRDV